MFMFFSSSECVTWLSLGMIESAVIIAGNLISIILFMKNNCLRKRGLFLVINLTVADMLAGGSFIADLFFTLDAGGCTFSEFNLGSYWRAVPLHFAILFFPLTSLTNIAMISLQQTHATFRPFQHRVIKKWVYGVASAVVWVLAATVSATLVAFKLSTNSRSHYFYLRQSYNCLCLFFICVSYASIVVKCLYGTHPQHHGAASRQRKLTVTLFIMTIASLLMWLPYVIATFVYYKTTRMKSYQTKLRVQYSLLVFLHINSLANPIVYTVRMPRFRKALLTLFNCRQKQNVAIIPLRAR